MLLCLLQLYRPRLYSLLTTTAYYVRRTTSCLLQLYRPCLYSLLTTYHVLLTTYDFLPAVALPPPLLTTHYLPRTTYDVRPTTCCSSTAACRSRAARARVSTAAAAASVASPS